MGLISFSGPGDEDDADEPKVLARPSLNMENEFKNAWAKVKIHLPLGEPSTVFKDLTRFYSSPDRFYHNFKHIEEGLKQILEIKDKLVYPEEVIMAWYFHDAVYDTRAKDNEEKSAWMAHNHLAPNGIISANILRIDGLVLSTKHTGKVLENDAKYMVDVDLSIFGQTKDTFDEYESNIRKEYSWVSEGDFRRKRSSILECFLARRRIYQTDLFAERYEGRARINLERSLDRLRS